MVFERNRAHALGLKVKRQRYPQTCTSTCIIMSRDIARILHYGTQESVTLNSTDMHFFGMLREKYAKVMHRIISIFYCLSIFNFFSLSRDFDNLRTSFY